MYISLLISEEIDIQLKNRLEREKSNDTTSGGSNVTVIESHVPEGSVENVCVEFLNKSVVEFENESDKNSAKHTEELSSTSAHNSASIPSCLLRRDSTRASVKKKVRCSETAEVIPTHNYFINIDTDLHIEEDEDDVFCDSAPAQIPRGNMCTPYVKRKGSLPQLEALPEWFPNARCSYIISMYLLFFC
jgi:hypothetical protein